MPKQNTTKKIEKKILNVIANQKRKKKNKPKQKITTVGKAIRLGGQVLGSMVGQGGLGRMAGAGISRILGQGDYSVNRVSKNSLFTGGVPSFSPLTSGFRIRNREYIQDVSSTTNFTNITFPLNPGLNETFPWLSTIAVNFEEYKIHGMVVYLNTLSGVAVASTNTALGLWGVVTQYDPTEPAFTTKQEAENYVGCQTTVPSNNLIHGIECAPHSLVLNNMYVRSGVPDGGGEDLKFYDWGKINLFTGGSQNSNTIGEMWISYDIEFFKPKLPPGGSNPVYSDQYYSTAVPGNNPTPNGLVPLAGSTLGSLCQGGIIVIPSTAPNGTYLFVYRAITSTTFTQTAPAVTASGSLVAVNFFSSATAYTGPMVSPLVYAPNATVALNATECFAFVFQKTTIANGGLSINGRPWTNANIDFVITQLTAGLTEPLRKQMPLGRDELEWFRQFMTRVRRDEADGREEDKIQTPKMKKKFMLVETTDT